MELTRVNTQNILKGIEKRLFFFFVCFLISQVQLSNVNYIFTLPLLSISFMGGLSYIICYFISILISITAFNVSITLLFLSIIAISTLELLSYIYSMKSKFIPFILTFIVLLALSLDLIFFEVNTWSIIIIYSLVTYSLSYLYIKNIPFFIHNTYEKMNYYHLFVISIMLILSCFVLFPINITAMFIFIRFFTLAIIYIAGFEKTYSLVLLTSLLLLIGDFGVQNQVISLILPIAIFYIIKPQYKLLFGISYLLSHLIIPFFIEQDILIYALEISISTALFMLIPNYIYQNIKRAIDTDVKIINQIGGVISYQRKMSRKLDIFSDLFNRIALSFKDSEVQTNVLTYVGNVYDNICANCLNKDQCFHHKQDINRLVKLIKKGVISSLSKEEIQHIDRYCLNPNDYKQAIKQQFQLYKHQVEMNDEYHFLKKNLYNQLILVGDILKNYSNNVNCLDIYSEENIKEVLEGYHFKIPYIHKDYISKDEFCLDLGIMETTKKEIHDVVIPVLEKTLDSQLNLLNIKSVANQMGYTRILLSNQQNYQLIYGIQQLSKDLDYCGDNYLFFRHNQFSMIALSDGMGYGKKAHDESKLTLDVFSKLLKSGINLEESIQTINSLLKIKNRIEMFTTLDLLMFDCNNGQVTFLKNGAMPSYVYHYNHLEKVQTKSLPIGIVAKVDTTREIYNCKHNNLIIMFSDGFETNIEEIIDEVLNKYYTEHPQIIADALMSELLVRNQVKDDTSIIVARIEDLNQITSKLTKGKA